MSSTEFVQGVVKVNSFIITDQNKSFANSVDPDETAHDEPSHQDLLCLPFCL